MLRSPLTRWIIGIVAFIAILALVRFKPWQHRSVGGMLGSVSKTSPQELKIGYLPVTCHLTCPVTDFATRTSTANRFESQRFTDFPTVVESVKGGRLDATFMIAPLAMKLREQGVPVKIVYLGHRDGSTVIVRKDLPARSLADLRGKTFAIPSKYSNQYLVIRKLMKDQGVDPKDIRFVEMPPPDMPAALYAKAVDAYCTGEPFGAAAQRAGYARALRMTRDEWRNYICCVLTVREELIRDNRPLVQDLVNHVQAAGSWLDAGAANREKAVRIAAGRSYFNQDPKIIRFVMDNPADRVTYGDLRMIRAEFEELMQLSIEAGTIKHPIAYETYVDERFARAAKAAQIAI